MALFVEIVTPEQKVFSGDATSIKVPGVNGSFEILNLHAPIISTLGKGQVRVVNAENKTTTYDVQDGVVEVLNNRVSVLVEKLIETEA